MDTLDQTPCCKFRPRKKWTRCSKIPLNEEDIERCRNREGIEERHWRSSFPPGKKEEFLEASSDKMPSSQAVSRQRAWDRCGKSVISR